MLSKEILDAFDQLDMSEMPADKVYTISIEETVSQDFDVEASSMEEAMKIAAQKYYNCEFVVNSTNVVDKQMQGYNEITHETTEWREF